MTRRRPGGFHRVAPFIDPPVHLQPVLAAAEAHELPHPHRPRARAGVGLEGAFRLGHEDQVERNPFFPQNGVNHLAIAPGAPQPIGYNPAPAPLLEIVQHAQHPVVYRHRKVVGQRAEFGFHFAAQLGVKREGQRRNLGQFFQGRGDVGRLRRRCRLAQRLQLQPVDAVDNVVEAKQQPGILAQLKG